MSSLMLLFLEGWYIQLWHDPHKFWARQQEDSKKELFVHLALFQKEVLWYVSESPRPFSDWTVHQEDLLESETIILMFIICYSERIQIKIGKGKRLMGQNTEETKLSGIPSQRSCTGCSEFSHQSCVTTNVKFCQPGMLSQTSASRVFIRGQSWRHATPMWLTSVSQTPTAMQRQVLP